MLDDLRVIFAFMRKEEVTVKALTLTNCINKIPSLKYLDIIEYKTPTSYRTRFYKALKDQCVNICGI